MKRLQTIATSVAGFAGGRVIPNVGNSFYPRVGIDACQECGEEEEYQEMGRG